MKLKDRVAVVTGAGSGIGRAIAMELARQGCHLALADIDEQAVRNTAHEAAALGVRATHHRVDVTDRAAVAQLPQQVLAAHGAVHLLVNNAGVALGGNFDQVGEADFDWLMDVNFHGLVRMTRAFLPLLKQADEGRIVNVSSAFGLVSPPGQAAYSASKFAVRGFSQALRHELAGTSVGVSLVHPGGVATAITKNARIPPGLDPALVQQRREQMERMLRMPAQRAGEIIVAGIRQDKPRILVGSDAKFAAFIERLMPVSYWRVLGALVERR